MLIKYAFITLLKVVYVKKQQQKNLQYFQYFELTSDQCVYNDHEGFFSLLSFMYGQSHMEPLTSPHEVWRKP